MRTLSTGYDAQSFRDVSEDSFSLEGHDMAADLTICLVDDWEAKGHGRQGCEATFRLTWNMIFACRNDGARQKARRLFVPLKDVEDLSGRSRRTTKAVNFFFIKCTRPPPF